MRGQACAGERKDAWESKMSFAICIIPYISQAPQADNKVHSYRVWFAQGWLHPTSHPKNMQFNKKVAQSNRTHFDLVWVPALLFSVTTHFRANTVSKGPASSISPTVFDTLPNTRVFFQTYAAKSPGNWRCSINILFSSLMRSKGSGGPILNKNLKAAADNWSTTQATGLKGECSVLQGCHWSTGNPQQSGWCRDGRAAKGLHPQGEETRGWTAAHLSISRSPLAMVFVCFWETSLLQATMLWIGVNVKTLWLHD